MALAEIRSEMDTDGEVRWVPSPGMPSRNYAIIALFLGYVAFLDFLVGTSRGWSTLQSALEFSSSRGDWGLTVVFWEFNAGLLVVIVAVSLWTTTVRIGLGRGGIRVVTRLRTRVVPWQALRPAASSPKGRWGLLRAADTPGQRSPRAFFVTRDQARLILTHPNAPSSLFPPEYWSWIGVEQPLRAA